jgi:hypothetical protein
VYPTNSISPPIPREKKIQLAQELWIIYPFREKVLQYTTHPGNETLLEKKKKYWGLGKNRRKKKLSSHFQFSSFCHPSNANQYVK